MRAFFTNRIYNLEETIVNYSVVIRTYNEEQHLGELLSKLLQQNLLPNEQLEVIVVDSGSDDQTLEIANQHNCTVIQIKKDDFTFGYSLNVGCQKATGDIILIISGHCIPVNNNWLHTLSAPLNNKLVYSYGKQIGHDTTKFSERELFNKHFTRESKVPQQDIYCNNANAALLKKTWRNFPFDESLTGLEDIDLSKRLIAAGFQVGYCSDAPVYHIHNESWRKIKLRYQREALALKKILPEVHVTLFDSVRYFFASIFNDVKSALKQKSLFRHVHGIILFRFMQYYGTYVGNHRHKAVTNQLKKRFFYP